MWIVSVIIVDEDWCGMSVVVCVVVVFLVIKFFFCLSDFGVIFGFVCILLVGSELLFYIVLE